MSQAEIPKTDNPASREGLSIILIIGGHKYRTWFGQCHRMIQGIEQVLIERGRQFTGFLVHLDAGHKRKLQRMQK